MDKKLNKNEIIKLISLYRCNDCLWNMNSNLYRRNDLKMKAYEDIALQMGMPTDVVKKKIRNLRSTYIGEKNKMYKKSGSETEEVYRPTLFWFEEMRFLDASIAVRTSIDNSEQNIENLREFEDHSDEISNITSKNVSKRPRKDEEESKFDSALNKLMDLGDKENEFTAFGASLGFQLQKFPEEDAYQLMGEIQNLLVQRKLYNMRQNKFRPISVEGSRYNSTEVTSSLNGRSSKPLQASTPRSTSNVDILSCAISNAGIENDVF
ncbi:uncharacterized protein [Musca autumnalis]|uniref:uncharacterized protein n=1 Tax=Musca autumnalis TaxID=221902 RepID=UPI003CF52FDA